MILSTLSCNHDYNNLEKLVDNSSILNNYDKIIVIAPGCKGCIQEKIHNLKTNTKVEDRKNYIFILDTEVEDNYSEIRASFSYLMRSNYQIDKYFHDKKNYIMFKRDKNKSISSETFNNTGDTTNMLTFFNSSEH